MTKTADEQFTSTETFYIELNTRVWQANTSLISKLITRFRFTNQNNKLEDDIRCDISHAVARGTPIFNSM